MKIEPPFGTSVRRDPRNVWSHMHTTSWLLSLVWYCQRVQLAIAALCLPTRVEIATIRQDQGDCVVVTLTAMQGLKPWHGVVQKFEEESQHFSNVPSVKWPMGFAKVPYQGRPLSPPRPPKNAQTKLKRKVLGTPPPRGAHLGEEHVKWLSGRAEVLPPSPYTRPQECPKIFLKTYLVPGQMARLCQGTFEKPWERRLRHYAHTC